jgi:hypothetical protein
MCHPAGRGLHFIGRALHICCKHVSDSGVHITKAFDEAGPHDSKPALTGPLALRRP